MEADQQNSEDPDQKRTDFVIVKLGFREGFDRGKKVDPVEGRLGFLEEAAEGVLGNTDLGFLEAEEGSGVLQEG